jgi:hypothetical protein
MVVTFEEKNNQKYEIDNKDTDKIFEDVKADVLEMLKKYKNDDIDLITTVLSLGCVANELKQSLSNRYGADKIINVTNAKLI